MTISPSTIDLLAPKWAHPAESDPAEGVYVRTIGGTDDIGISLMQNAGDRPFLALWAGGACFELPVDTDLNAISEAFASAATTIAAIDMFVAEIVYEDPCLTVYRTPAGMRAHVEHWGYRKGVTGVYIQRLVVDGLERGCSMVPVAPGPCSPAAELLSKMAAGETQRLPFKFGRGYSTEQHEITLVGEFEVLSVHGARAVLVERTAAS